MKLKKKKRAFFFQRESRSHQHYGTTLLLLYSAPVGRCQLSLGYWTERNRHLEKRMKAFIHGQTHYTYRRSGCCFFLRTTTIPQQSNKRIYIQKMDLQSRRKNWRAGTIHYESDLSCQLERGAQHEGKGKERVLFDVDAIFPPSSSSPLGSQRSPHFLIR